ncbi:MAG TPA: hypothetical protein VJB38_14945 [Bacteroidota bacterium]|nr:hypothetical protein [Bacteroidota bacterium]
MKRATFVILLGSFLAQPVVSQWVAEKAPKYELTGNLRWDLSLGSGIQDTLPQSAADEGKKSALTAALLSAAVPGAGEFYAESYWRAGLFFAAEATLWIVYATQTSKADRQTEEFQKFADTHWSVVKYAEWMERHGASLNTTGTPPPSGIVTSSDPNNAPWDRVNWNLLNEWEQFIGGRAPTGFSHRLPRRPDQQYYELIGKYLQYNVGWPEWDPAVSSGYLDSPTPRFADYRDMRGRANDFYSIASTAGFLVVANHLLSALDAAWSASQYNAGVKVRAHLQPTVREYGFVEFVPTATVTMEF